MAQVGFQQTLVKQESICETKIYREIPNRYFAPQEVTDVPIISEDLEQLSCLP